MTERSFKDDEDRKRWETFLEDAARADAEMEASGLGYRMDDVHPYVLARLRGERPTRPRLVRWRRER